MKLLEVLSVNLAQVFNAIQGRQPILPPRKIQKEANKLNSNKYCNFHNNIGHNTKNCQELMKEP